MSSRYAAAHLAEFLAEVRASQRAVGDYPDRRVQYRTAGESVMPGSVRHSSPGGGIVRLPALAGTARGVGD